MFKRLVWLTMGFMGGLASSFWVTQKLRRAASRLTPERLAGGAASAARGVVAEVKAAVAEGRTAMKESEDQLRAEIGRPAP